MILKLHKNEKLRIKKHDDTSTTEIENEVSDNFKERVTGIMITECPNINAKTIVDKVKTFQSGSGRTKRLTNIRFQLPYDSSTGNYKYNGTYDELYGYTKFGTINVSGFDNEGKFQSKPAIVGDWYMSDYVDSTMLQTLTGDGSGNGLYRTTEPSVKANYIIDWDKIAVQSVDSTKPNYNPAVAVILNSHNLGTVHENTNHFAGKWWITKDEVSKIKNIDRWFASIETIQDTEGIVSSNKSSLYSFTNFDALSSFTGLSTIATSAFINNKNLISVRLPNSLKTIPTKAFYGCENMEKVGSIPSSVSNIQESAFDGCAKVIVDSLGDNVTEIGASAFNGCAKLNVTKLPDNLTYVLDSAFDGCNTLKINEIPESVAYIGNNAFKNCTSITSLHIKNDSTDMKVMSGAFDGGSYEIYVGDTYSSLADNRILNNIENDSSLDSFSGRVYSYYQKHYSTKVPAGYEVQNVLISDGNNIIAPVGVNYMTGIQFLSELEVSKQNEGDKPLIHGSSSMGLSGTRNTGFISKSALDNIVHVASNEHLDNGAHRYLLDNKTSEVKRDDIHIFGYNVETTGDNSPITFFGDSIHGGFIGKSWMNRVYDRGGNLVHDFVPVKQISNSEYGFYDVIARKFYGSGYFMSDKSIFAAGIGDAQGSEIVTEDGNEIVFG